MLYGITPLLILSEFTKISLRKIIQLLILTLHLIEI